MIIAVPTGLRFLVDSYNMGGNVKLTTPMLCFRVYHIIYTGGLTGIVLANAGIDMLFMIPIMLVAHFHMYYLWEQFLLYFLDYYWFEFITVINIMNY
jgi:cytochrome c oxidase subunit 1